MKHYLTLLFIFLFYSTAISQTLEQAIIYYSQDSIEQASGVVEQLDPSDNKVVKLRRKIEERRKEMIIENQLLLREEAEKRRAEEASLVRIYGEIPTFNESLKWENDRSSDEKYIGVIYIDSTIKANEIIGAWMATFQPVQDANLMTKQMRTNNSIGSISAAFGGDIESIEGFAKAGDADSRRQYERSTSWTVQFIDGVRLNRFYYNIHVEARTGRYKLTVVPSGISGYAQDHIQIRWSQIV